MIGLYRGKSAVSRTIMWENRSEYSHASWLCADGSVIESWADRFFPTPVGSVRHEPTVNHGHTPGTVIDVFDFKEPLAPEQRAGIEAFMRGEIGKRYDFWALVGFVSRRPRRDNGKWFCSELVFAACRKNDRELLSRIESWAVYPGMISLSPLLMKVDEITTVAVDQLPSGA